MNISVSEVLLVLLIALFVIKPEQLPEIAYALGRCARFLRRLFHKAKVDMQGLVDSVDKPKA